MGKATDETGNRHGRWTVLRRAENNKKGQACWLCRCDCGVERVVLGADLRYGHSQSCGCLQREVAGQYHFVDRTGQRYGRLTVIGQEESTDEGKAKWLCQCDCGKTTVVTGHNLQSGNTKSCGCLWKDTVTAPEGEAAFNQLVNRLQWDAKNRGLDWELSKSDVRALTSQPCFYCGCNPSQIAMEGQYNGDYTYNGIDRLDSKLGYVSGNVVSCCKRCNYAKHVMTVSEFRNWVQTVYEHFVKQ